MCYQPLDLKKFGEVRQVLDRTLTGKGQGQQQQGQGSGLRPPVKAPLATPEPVEMPGDYAQVKVSHYDFH